MASYIFIQFNPKHADGFYFAATTKIVGVNIKKKWIYILALWTSGELHGAILCFKTSLQLRQLFRSVLFCFSRPQSRT